MEQGHTCGGKCNTGTSGDSLHYFSIRLNSISVVNLVLALGLSVDYAAHIAHRFVESASEEVEASDDEQGPRLVGLDAIESGAGAAGAWFGWSAPV